MLSFGKSHLCLQRRLLDNALVCSAKQSKARSQHASTHQLLVDAQLLSLAGYVKGSQCSHSAAQ